MAEALHVGLRSSPVSIAQSKPGASLPSMSDTVSVVPSCSQILNVCTSPKLFGLPPMHLLPVRNNTITLSRSSFGRWSSGGQVRQRRGRAKPVCPSCLHGAAGSIMDAMIIELPCLPFSPTEVFVPSSSKTLHLYEARFLALLDEVMGKYKNLLAHIILEPVSAGSKEDGKGTSSFLATYGCLARVENVERLKIGAAVTIRGIGRIKLTGITQLEPFLKSTVLSLKDDEPEDDEAVSSALDALQVTLQNVQELQIKLKVKSRENHLFQAEVSGDQLLQTPLQKALWWAKKGEPDNVAEVYIPSLEERLSFAALQPLAGATAGEQHRLLQERLYAMEAMSTMQRLKRVKPYAEQTLANLAAKVALQSLNL